MLQFCPLYHSVSLTAVKLSLFFNPAQRAELFDIIINIVIIIVVVVAINI